MKYNPHSPQRERTGHYEIHTSKGWKRIEKVHLQNLVASFALWPWYLDCPITLTDLIRDEPDRYRFVED